MGYFQRSLDNPLFPATVHLPTGTYELLKEISLKRDLPISKLICYAVDNELDCEEPFTYNLTWHEEAFENFEFADEAVKILKYIMAKFPKGTGLDTLLLCRRDFGVPEKRRFLMGYKELLKREMIEEFYPQESKFKYAKDYRYIRPSRQISEVYGKKETKNTDQKGPLNEI